MFQKDTKSNFKLRNVEVIFWIRVPFYGMRSLLLLNSGNVD